MVRKLTMAVALLSLLWSVGQAQDPAVKTKAPPPTYSVLQTTHSEKDISYQVLTDKDASEKIKEAEKSYMDAMKRWEKARQEAEKNKTEMQMPKPERPMLRVIASHLDEAKAKEEMNRAEKEFKIRMERERMKEKMKNSQKSEKNPPSKETENKNQYR